MLLKKWMMMVVSSKKTDPKLVTISLNCKETQLRRKQVFIGIETSKS